MPRPSSYTEEIGDQICEALADGKSLRTICDLEGMPDRSTVQRWVDNHPAFRGQYARARDLGYDLMAYDVLRIADDGSKDYVIENKDGVSVIVPDHARVQRDRLRVDSRKWILSKLAPRRYGDSPAEPAALEGSISRIERVILRSPKAEPEPTNLLAYVPPSPGDITPEQWGVLRHLLNTIERTVGEKPADEVFAVIRAALLSHFGAETDTSSS